MEHLPSPCSVTTCWLSEISHGGRRGHHGTWQVPQTVGLLTGTHWQLREAASPLSRTLPPSFLRVLSEPPGPSIRAGQQQAGCPRSPRDLQQLHWPLTNLLPVGKLVLSKYSQRSGALFLPLTALIHLGLQRASEDPQTPSNCKKYFVLCDLFQGEGLQSLKVPKGIHDSKEVAGTTVAMCFAESGWALPPFMPLASSALRLTPTEFSPLVPCCPGTLWGLGYQGVRCLQGRPSHPAVLGNP